MKSNQVKEEEMEKIEVTVVGTYGGRQMVVGWSPNSGQVPTNYLIRKKKANLHEIKFHPQIFCLYLYRKIDDRHKRRTTTLYPTPISQ